MKKLVIFGISEYSEVASYYFNNHSDYKIISYTADDEYVTSNKFNNLDVLPYSEIYKHKEIEDDTLFFIAIGYSKNNEIRKNTYNKLKKDGVSFAKFISNDALIAKNSKIGDNVFILEQNNIQAFVEIGNNVVLWSGNHIGHHSKINDHTFITSHVVVSGGVDIGESCFLGVNSTIVDHIALSENSFVKANSLVSKSV
jgi:sugar O-acyltransferase (sialic acid O-acetyltransferase NeuD family)